MRRPPLLLALALLALAAAPARAQMPNLHAIVGKPLPVPDLPAGTVSVRVARKTPANAAAGVEVTAVITPPGGDSRQRSEKTGADGRATFAGVAAGATFQAKVAVDGETLETSSFAVPAQGGTRVMLIAGLPPAGAESPGEGAHGPQPTEGEGNFKMGAVTGSVTPVEDLPAGTLELDVVDEAGKPLGGVAVRLGQVALSGPADGERVKVHPVMSSAQGRARWENLPTGAGTGYAAVMDRNGHRVSTEPFRMPPETGMRGRLAMMTSTRDPSVLRADARSRMALDVREDNITVMIALVFQNPSNQTFDPGPEGLLVKLPEGAISAQEIEGGVKVEVRPDGLHIHGAILPNSAASFATQAMFGYVLPGHGDDTIELRQQLPVMMQEPLIIVPEKSNLRLSGPGLKRQKDDENRTGDKLHIYTLDTVAAGGTLSLTVTGVPTRDRSGATIAAVLCLLLVAAAIVLARKPEGARAQAASKEALVQRREKLFAELIPLERQRRAASASPDGGLERRRRELRASLETVYRELAEREAQL
jgi:hypothetical protein